MMDDEIEAHAQGTGFSNVHKVLRTASDHVNLEKNRVILPFTSFGDFLGREMEAVERA